MPAAFFESSSPRAAKYGFFGFLCIIFIFPAPRRVFPARRLTVARGYEKQKKIISKKVV